MPAHAHVDPLDCIVLTCHCGIAAHGRCSTCQTPFCVSHGLVQPRQHDVVSLCLEHVPPPPLVVQPKCHTCGMTTDNHCWYCQKRTCNNCGHWTDPQPHTDWLWGVRRPANMPESVKQCDSCHADKSARLAGQIASQPDVRVSAALQRLAAGERGRPPAMLRCMSDPTGWRKRVHEIDLGLGYNLGKQLWTVPRPRDDSHDVPKPTGYIISEHKLICLMPHWRTITVSPVLYSENLASALEAVLPPQSS